MANVKKKIEKISSGVRASPLRIISSAHTSELMPSSVKPEEHDAVAATVTVGGKTLGAITHALRKGSGLTLKALAAKTGMALSTLSKVENNQMSLTYDKLVQLAGGLGVDVAQLFDGASRQSPQLRIGVGRRSVNRLGEGNAVRTANYAYVYLSTDLSNRELIPMIVEVLATSSEQFSDSPHHPGEEFAYILEGELELHTEFYEPLLLKAGESISYDSGMRHAYVAKVSPCRVLVVGSKLPSPRTG